MKVGGLDVLLRFWSLLGSKGVAGRAAAALTIER